MFHMEVTEGRRLFLHLWPRHHKYQRFTLWLETCAKLEICTLKCNKMDSQNKLTEAILTRSALLCLKTQVGGLTCYCKEFTYIACLTDENHEILHNKIRCNIKYYIKQNLLCLKLSCILTGSDR